MKLFDSIRTVITVLLAIVASPPFALAANRITLKAVATDEYLEVRERDGAAEILTYQFLEGRRFTGKSLNKSLERMTFQELAVNLAENLVKQNFYPNPELGQGELLIVVHYGATDFEEDMMELLGVDSESDVLGVDVSGVDVGSASAADIAALLDVMDIMAANDSLTQALNSGNSLSQSQRAHILGIDEIRDLPDHMSGDYEYEQMLRQSRYFVVLMAFDYQLFLKKGKSKLLWSTRYNVRAAGQSFEAAIENMNLMASDYFGKQMDTLVQKRMGDTSSVDIGDIEVLDSEPENAEN